MTRTYSRSLATAAILASVSAIILPVVMAHAAPAAQVVDAQRASSFYEDALKRFHAKKYSGAVIQLKNALQRNPRSLPARILLGRTLNKLRRGEDAEYQLKLARGAGADDSKILIPLGEAYLAQGKFETLLREFPAGQRRPEIEAEVRVLRGLALANLGVIRKSEEEFRYALKIKPEFVKAHIGLASLRISRGSMKEANELLDEPARREPENETIWHLKGKIKLAQNNSKGALEHLDKALSLSPDLIEARVDRASVYLITGRREDAVKDLEIVHKVVPKHPRAALLRALAFVQVGESQKALALLEDVTSWIGVLSIETVMKSTQLMLLMGAINFSLQRYEEAVPFLQRYNELMPHIITRKMLAMIYLRNGNNHSALKLLEPILPQAPNDLQILTALAKAYTQARQYTKATKLFEKIASLAPQNPVAHTNLALNRLATGQADEARSELEEAVRLNPGRGRAGALLGLLHLRRGDTNSALEIAERLRKTDPNNPFPHNLAGSAYLKSRQFELARDSFQAALKIKPDYRPAIYNLATVVALLEGPEAAKSYYLSIIESDPSQIQAMDALADIALRRGKRDEAIKWLDRASKTDPTAIRPQLRLVNLLLKNGQLPEAMQMVESLENRAPRNLAVLDVKARIQKAGGNQADAIQTYRNAANSAAKTAPQLFRIALAQLAMQDLKGASFSLNSAVNLKPRMLPAQAALARLTYDLEGFKEAMEKVVALENKFPGSPVADTVKGDVLMRDKRYGDAIAAYQAAFAKTQNGALARRIFRVRWALGDKTASVKGLSDWLKIQPKDRQSQRILALAYLEAGDIESATSHHEALAEMAPQDVVIINNLANLYHRRGDDRAFEFAKRAYNLAPKLAHTIDTYGWMLVQKGDVEQGLTLLRNAQARANNQPAIGYHIAVALDTLGRHREAKREMEAAMAIGKKFAEEDLARKFLERLKRID